MNLFNTQSIRTLEKTIDAATLRQRVIANNVANVDTPNFKGSYVSFEDALSEAINPPQKLAGTRTNEKHMQVGRDRYQEESDPQVQLDTTTAMNNNYNNVDIDYQMAEMSKNQLRYNVLIQKMNSEFRNLKTAIEGR